MNGRTLQGQDVRDVFPGSLFGLRVKTVWQTPRVQRAREVHNPSLMEGVKGPGVHAGPVVNGHGGCALCGGDSTPGWPRRQA
jgi:hypothetical protein